MTTPSSLRRPQQRAASGSLPVLRRRGEEGYNLVMLIVAITILNVMVAVALPRWSYVIRRDREEEAIFRGLQYAEAIRVFRQRNGRYPTALEELVKVEPRSIRQLWTEPLTKDGEFGLVVEAPTPQQAANPRQPGAPPSAPGTPGAAPTPGPEPVLLPGGGRPNFGGYGIGGGSSVSLIKLPRGAKDASGTSMGKTVTSGPLAIHGVYIDLKGESLRKFFDKGKYEEWAFVAEIIPAPVTAAERPLPRVRADWLGKTFAEGLSPMLGLGAGSAPPPAPGTELGAGKPGTAPGAPTGIDRPRPEPGTPSEFPEDALPEVPEEEIVPDDTMRDEEPFPEDEDPSTEDPDQDPDDDPAADQSGDDQGAR